MKLTDILNGHKGLGDTVEVVTKVSGIKAVVESTNRVMGKEDCGCDKRKEFLNQKFPYKK